MDWEQRLQMETGRFSPWVARGKELIVPNPKLKLLDQVREVMRLKHYSIRTEASYCGWIKRYIKFHGMKSWEELGAGGLR